MHPSRSSRFLETLIAASLLIAVSGSALAWCLRRGYLLYFGDALSHLNIARRMVDSRTPGWEQIGTVWLPLPHVLMLPFVTSDTLWRSGLAGAIPSAFCYVVAGIFLFLAMRRALPGSLAAFVSLAVLALNPNLLYLQSVPMTESVFAAALCGVLYGSVVFAESPSLWAAAGTGIAALAGTLSRYEGWFLIPFVTAWILYRGGRKRWLAAVVFGAIASAGPLYWLLHNQWFYGDPLAFYRGKWSAKAIYQRAIERGMQPYPGDGDLLVAIHYFLAAARLCAGWTLSVLGVAGAAVAVWKRRWWPVVLLALPPIFYMFSIYSSGTPIFVPHLWPHSYYNTRYGLAALPFLAVGTGALAAWIPARFRLGGGLAIVVVALLPWIWQGTPEGWICWKEAEVNSVRRRAWTAEAAAYFRANYHGGGILCPFGDITGIFLEAGIPLRETLHSGNEPQFQAALGRPDLFLHEEWAVAVAGDPVDTALLRARKNGPRYECVKMIALKDAPVIRIYRRYSSADEYPIR